MTLYADLGTGVPAPPAKRRIITRARVIVASILLVLVGLSVGWLEYTAHYQPFGLPSPYGSGPINPAVVRGLNDGFKDTRWALVGPEGSIGGVTYMLANKGPFDVRISPSYRGKDWLHTTLRWSPFDLYSGTLGTPGDVRDFPMTLHAHQAIQLQLTMTIPDCRNTATEFTNAIAIRWSALGRHHLYFYPLSADTANNPIVVCPELSH